MVNFLDFPAHKYYISNCQCYFKILILVDECISDNWPKAGAIKFKNVYLNYNKNGDPVLKNLNVQIKNGWKVGKKSNIFDYFFSFQYNLKILR